MSWLFEPIAPLAPSVHAPVNYTVSLSETITISEAVATRAQYRVAVAETIQISEALDSRAEFTAAMATNVPFWYPHWGLHRKRTT